MSVRYVYCIWAFYFMRLKFLCIMDSILNFKIPIYQSTNQVIPLVYCSVWVGPHSWKMNKLDVCICDEQKVAAISRYALSHILNRNIYLIPSSNFCFSCRIPQFHKTNKTFAVAFRNVIEKFSLYLVCFLLIYQGNSRYNIAWRFAQILFTLRVDTILCDSLGSNASKHILCPQRV